MKKTIIIGLCAWCLAIGQAEADNTLSVANVNIPQDGQVTLNIMCNFEAAIVGGQLDIDLPNDGKVTLKMIGDKPVAALAFKGTNHSLNNSQRKNAMSELINSYRSLWVSMSNSPLPTGGVLLRLTLNASADAVEGTVYNAKLTGIELGTKDEQFKLADIPFTITIDKGGERGDANADYNVSVTDIAVVVNCILQLPNTGGFSEYGADANGDGSVTVTDIGVIVDKILGTNASSRKMGQELEPQ